MTDDLYGTEYATSDLNGDGFSDTVLQDYDGDGVMDLTSTDTDGDGLADWGTADTDHDGIANVEIADTDHDGVADVGMADTDDDGYGDTLVYADHLVYADGSTESVALDVEPGAIHEPMSSGIYGSDAGTPIPDSTTAAGASSAASA